MHTHFDSEEWKSASELRDCALRTDMPVDGIWTEMKARILNYRERERERERERDLISLFDVILTFVGYLMPKPSL